MTPIEWVERHRAQGHDATLTSVAAPGWGQGSWCHTCREYGPSTGGILTEEDVR